MLTFTVESGWSESMPRLQDDVNLPLVGSNGDMGKMALIVNWTRITGDQVTGTIVL